MPHGAGAEIMNCGSGFSSGRLEEIYRKNSWLAERNKDKPAIRMYIKAAEVGSGTSLTVDPDPALQHCPRI